MVKLPFWEFKSIVIKMSALPNSMASYCLADLLLAAIQRKLQKCHHNSYTGSK